MQAFTCVCESGVDFRTICGDLSSIHVESSENETQNGYDGVRNSREDGVDENAMDSSLVSSS